MILISLTLLGGCLGGRKSGGPSQVSTPVGTFGADTGAIEGQAVDVESLEGIKSVQIGILELPNMTTRTDPEGRYAFSDVPPGTYNIHFAAVGYKTKVEKAVVLANEKATANVMLEPDAAFIPPEPFAEGPLGPVKARIGCGISVPGGHIEPCGATEGPATGGELANAATFQKRDGYNITGFVVIVKWTKTSGLPGTNEFEVRTPVAQAASEEPFLRNCQGCEGVAPSKTSFVGGSGMAAYYDTLDPLHPIVRLPPGDNTMRFIIEPSSGRSDDTASWGIVFQQDVELYLCALYNGAAPPPSCYAV